MHLEGTLKIEQVTVWKDALLRYPLIWEGGGGGTQRPLPLLSPLFSCRYFVHYCHRSYTCSGALKMSTHDYITPQSRNHAHSSVYTSYPLCWTMFFIYLYNQCLELKDYSVYFNCMIWQGGETINFVNYYKIHILPYTSGWSYSHINKSVLRFSINWICIEHFPSKHGPWGNILHAWGKLKIQ